MSLLDTHKYLKQIAKPYLAHLQLVRKDKQSRDPNILDKYELKITDILNEIYQKRCKDCSVKEELEETLKAMQPRELTIEEKKKILERDFP